MIEQKIKGLKELDEALRVTIPRELRQRTLQSALAAGARLIVASAKAHVPVKTGRLRDSIASFRSRSGSNQFREERVIRPRSGKRFKLAGKDAFYWRWIELGRAAITKKGKGSLGTPATGFFGKKVRAIPAQPFLRPAFNSMKVEAAEAIERSLRAAVQRAAKKAAWRFFP